MKQKFYFWRGMIIFIAVVLMCFPVKAAEQFRIEWIKCSSDQECKVVKDACGGWIAINKNFETPFKDYQKQIMPHLECAEHMSSAQPEPVCLNEVCQTISKVDPSTEKIEGDANE